MVETMDNHLSKSRSLLGRRRRRKRQGSTGAHPAYHNGGSGDNDNELYWTSTTSGQPVWRQDQSGFGSTATTTKSFLTTSSWSFKSNQSGTSLASVTPGEPLMANHSKSASDKLSSSEAAFAARNGMQEVRHFVSLPCHSMASNNNMPEAACRELAATTEQKPSASGDRPNVDSCCRRLLSLQSPENDSDNCNLNNSRPCKEEAASVNEQRDAVDRSGDRESRNESIIAQLKEKHAVELQRQEESHSQMMETLRLESQARIDDLERQLRISKEQGSQKESDLRKLEADFEQLKIFHADQTATLDERDKENEVLKKENQVLRLIVRRRGSVLAERNSEINRLNDKLNNLESGSEWDVEAPRRCKRRLRFSSASESSVSSFVDEIRHSPPRQLFFHDEAPQIPSRTGKGEELDLSTHDRQWPLSTVQEEHLQCKSSENGNAKEMATSASKATCITQESCLIPPLLNNQKLTPQHGGLKHLTYNGVPLRLAMLNHFHQPKERRRSRRRTNASQRPSRCQPSRAPVQRILTAASP